ncbi:hypothetical protein DDE82_007270 [Stemphylium lycopersici]|nr:hypothetical protein DDE82_007270 [Stemphylium lycopersici]
MPLSVLCLKEGYSANGGNAYEEPLFCWWPASWL